jgi:hypothetical protein
VGARERGRAVDAERDASAHPNDVGQMSPNQLTFS